jgi:hypothetical protein
VSRLKNILSREIYCLEVRERTLAQLYSKVQEFQVSAKKQSRSDNQKCTRRQKAAYRYLRLVMPLKTPALIEVKVLLLRLLQQINCQHFDVCGFNQDASSTHLLLGMIILNAKHRIKKRIKKQR